MGERFGLRIGRRLVSAVAVVAAFFVGTLSAASGQTPPRPGLATTRPLTGVVPTGNQLSITSITSGQGAQIQGPAEGYPMTPSNSIVIHYSYLLSSTPSARIWQRAITPGGTEAVNQSWSYSIVNEGSGTKANALTILCKSGNQAPTQVASIRYRLTVEPGSDVLIDKTYPVNFTFTCPQRSPGLQRK